MCCCYDDLYMIMQIYAGFTHIQLHKKYIIQNSGRNFAYEEVSSVCLNIHLLFPFK